MKILWACFGLFVLLGLNACSSPSVKNTDDVSISWQVQQQRLLLLNHWSIKGRISVQTEFDGGQADYLWQQHSLSNYDIRLQAPMGAGTTLINANSQGVSLKTSSGTELFDSDVDHLMLQLNGWPLPVSGLRYWLKGLPTPDSEHEVSEWNARGLPQVILQDGWRVEFRKYKSVKEFLLPGKLFISRVSGDEIDVRLIIRTWVLEK